LFGHLFKSLPRHKKRTDLRDRDFTVPIHGEIILGIDSSPKKQFDLIPRANDVFQGNRNIFTIRDNTNGRLGKEIEPERFEVNGDILIFPRTSGAFKKGFFSGHFSNVRFIGILSCFFPQILSVCRLFFLL